MLHMTCLTLSDKKIKQRTADDDWKKTFQSSQKITGYINHLRSTHT